MLAEQNKAITNRLTAPLSDFGSGMAISKRKQAATENIAINDV